MPSATTTTALATTIGTVTILMLGNTDARTARMSCKRERGKRDQAEGEGFEPSSDVTARNGFRDRRIRPLCHPSTEPLGRLDRVAGVKRRRRDSNPRGRDSPHLTP